MQPPIFPPIDVGPVVPAGAGALAWRAALVVVLLAVVCALMQRDRDE
jgi:hypothetical protein